MHSRQKLQVENFDLLGELKLADLLLIEAQSTKARLSQDQK